MGMSLTIGVYMVSIVNFNCSQLITRLLLIISIVVFEAVNTKKICLGHQCCSLVFYFQHLSLLSRLKIKTIVIQSLKANKFNLKTLYKRIEVG